jgi:hypothetical protein
MGGAIGPSRRTHQTADADPGVADAVRRTERAALEIYSGSDRCAPAGVEVLPVIHHDALGSLAAGHQPMAAIGLDLLFPQTSGSLLRPFLTST